MKQAEKWIDQALAKDPDACFMHMRSAQIEEKLGNKKEATASAEKAIEILKKEKAPDEALMRQRPGDHRQLEVGKRRAVRASDPRCLTCHPEPRDGRGISRRSSRPQTNIAPRQTIVKIHRFIASAALSLSLTAASFMSVLDSRHRSAAR